jgi:hypothetical protein
MSKTKNAPRRTAPSPIHIAVVLTGVGNRYKFLLNVLLDPREVIGTNGDTSRPTLLKMSPKALKAAIQAALEYVVISQVKVSPLKGEIVKAEAAFQRYLTK